MTTPPRESFITRLRRKLHENSDQPRDDKFEADGTPKLEFKNGIPDFLNSRDPQFDAKSARFKEYVAKHDAALVPTVEKVLAGTPIGKEDFEQFTGAVAAFKERWEAAEKLSKRVTPEVVKQIAQMSGRGEFGTLAYAYGPDSLAKVWQEKIPLLVVNDDEKFDALKTSFDKYDLFVRTTEQKIRERAERLGISQAVYEDIITEGDPAVRRKALREVLDRKYGRGNGVINKARKFLSGFTQEHTRKSASGRAELEASLGLINQQIKEIGEMLLSTVGNFDVQDAILSNIHAVEARPDVTPADDDDDDDTTGSTL